MNVNVSVQVDQGLPSTQIPSVGTIGGRLTLTSGVAAPEADVAGAISIFYAPSTGQQAPIFDGENFANHSVATQLALPLDADAGHTGYQAASNNYDLFLTNDGGLVRLVTGPSWSAGGGSDIARGVGAGSTELEVFGGILVNKNGITVRFGVLAADSIIVPARQATYVGTFRPTMNGQATDTRRQRFLYNAYNKIIRPVRARDTAINWTYSVGAYRQVNGSASNQVEVLSGLAGDSVHARALSVVSSTVAGVHSLTGIGIDGIAPANDGLAGYQAAIGTSSYSVWAEFNGPLGLGLHSLRWLEYGGGSGTQTWLGTNNDTSVFKNGISGWVMG